MKISRMLARFLSRVVLLLVFCILGVGAGLGLGHLFVYLDSEGLFSSWHLLEGRSDFRAIIEATSQDIWAQSDSGKIYHLNSNCYRRETVCNTWQETNTIPSDLHSFWEKPIERALSCEGFTFLGKPPDTVIECVRTHLAGPEFGTVVYYSLTGHGAIWSWTSNGSMIIALWTYLLSIIVGLGAGIVLFMIFIERRKKNPETRFKNNI